MAAQALDPAVDITPHVEKIREVQDAVDQVPAYLIEFKQSYLTRAESGELARLGSSQSNLAKYPTLPVLAKDEAQLQKEYLKKLKSKYIEHSAKVQFLKFIRKDEGEQSVAKNEQIDAQNKIDKAELQEHKNKLHEAFDRARSLAERLENDRPLLIQEAKDASKLAAEVSEMRLELMRLRRDKPPAERLTTAQAETQLDSQVMELQELDDQLREVQSKTLTTKIAAEKVANEVEQIRPEVVKAKAQLEAMNALQRNSQAAEETAMLSGLCDWYSLSTEFFKRQFGLEALAAPSENELKLTFTAPLRYSISLIFNHVTRRLADVQISGLDDTSDLQEVIALAVEANDVRRLLLHIRAVVWRKYSPDAQYLESREIRQP